jgi:hypothetical protein
MVLFKLEIPIPGPNLGGSGGIMKPLEVFGSVGTPQKALSCARPRRLTIDRQNRPSRFCWARLQETNKKINKLTESLYVDPLWADDEFWSLMSSPERDDLC